MKQKQTDAMSIYPTVARLGLSCLVLLSPVDSECYSLWSHLRYYAQRNERGPVYVICPNTDLIVPEDTNQYISVSNEVIIQCGDKGERNDNCTIQGGIEQIRVRNTPAASLTMMGVTMKKASGTSVRINIGSDNLEISFIDCAWEDNIFTNIGTKGAAAVEIKNPLGHSNTNVIFSGCNFRGNDSPRGAVLVEGSALDIDRCTFKENKSSESPWGSTINVKKYENTQYHGHASIASHSCFINNIASGKGTVYVEQGSTLPYTIFPSPFCSRNNTVNEGQNTKICRGIYYDGDALGCQLFNGTYISYLTEVPTTSPSHLPSSMPSQILSLFPSQSPSSMPTSSPSSVPSQSKLSPVPTYIPSHISSELPTLLPSLLPSYTPTHEFILKPSTLPSDQLSNIPSNIPSLKPSLVPSAASPLPATLSPLHMPSYSPSVMLPLLSSHAPSVKPSTLSSHMPINEPSFLPSPSGSLVPSASKSPSQNVNPPYVQSKLPSAFPTMVENDSSLKISRKNERKLETYFLLFAFSPMLLIACAAGYWFRDHFRELKFGRVHPEDYPDPEELVHVA